MTKKSVWSAPDLKNHTSYDCHLWCKYVKWYLEVFFFFNFKILIFQVVRGLKGQKMAQNVKKSVCLTPYLRNRISYDCDFWYICVKWWYLQQIFAFFKFWFFGFLGSKRAKNDLKLPISACLALYLRNCRSYHWDFDNDIHRCFSLFF